ncbi:MAG: hypothetical protein V3T58_06195 [Candidatus Hydrothermarchaeales archaeon]
MDRRMPNFILMHDKITYIVIGADLMRPPIGRTNAVIKKPRRLDSSSIPR